MPRRVSLLSCEDVFVCRTNLSHNCSVKEKVEFKRGKDVSEEIEKLYLGDMFSSYDGASETVSARIGSVWESSRKLGVVLVGKQGLAVCDGMVIYLFLFILFIIYFIFIYPRIQKKEKKKINIRYQNEKKQV